MVCHDHDQEYMNNDELHQWEVHHQHDIIMDIDDEKLELVPQTMGKYRKSSVDASLSEIIEENDEEEDEGEADHAIHHKPYRKLYKSREERQLFVDVTTCRVSTVKHSNTYN